MNAGYIPLRRGLLEHVQTGKLSVHEFAAFAVLLMLADKQTGKGFINAPVLRSWLPDLTYDAAKRALLSLEEKQYIFREITPFSKRVYPFWIARFCPTTGPHKLLQTDLSQVFQSKCANDVRYVEAAPQTSLNNEKEKDKDLQKEENPIPKRRDSFVTEFVRDSVTENVTQLCRARDFHVIQNVTPAQIASASGPVADSVKCNGNGAGLRWSGADGLYVDTLTNSTVPYDIAVSRIHRATGLRKEEGKFFLGLEEVPWKEAQQIIRGADTGREQVKAKGAA